MKGKHAQKNFGAIGTMAPTPLSLKTPGGGGGGGWGVSHTRTGPGCPSPPCSEADTVDAAETCISYGNGDNLGGLC